MEKQEKLLYYGVNCNMNENRATFTAAVIGLGFIEEGDRISDEAIGQDVDEPNSMHAQILAANPQVQLVTGSSRDEGRRKRFEERMGVTH